MHRNARMEDHYRIRDSTDAGKNEKGVTEDE